MKEFLMKNVGNFITVVVLIVGIAVAWGIIKTEVDHNTLTIVKNEGHIERIRDWQTTTDVQFAEIQKDLQYIKALLIEIKGSK